MLRHRLRLRLRQADAEASSEAQHARRATHAAPGKRAVANEFPPKQCYMILGEKLSWK